MTVKNINNRVLVFPSQGRLIISTDLHGNKRDYMQVLRRFEASLDSTDDSYLLFLGDLVHGMQNPSQANEYNPYYDDESEFVVDHFIRMQDAYPGRVFSLLGNHEHGHVGGMHTEKFGGDEVVRLEEKIGKEKAKKYQELFNTFPLIALTPCGVVFSHGAPSPNIEGIDRLINISYQSNKITDVEERDNDVLLSLLWRYGANEEDVRTFLKLTQFLSIENRVAVHGHDSAPEGFMREGPQCMIFSTSYKIEDENKFYLELDLSKEYRTTADFREGKELRKLWDKVVPNVDGFDYEFPLKAINDGKYDTALFALQQAPEDHFRNYLLGVAHFNKATENGGTHLDQAIGFLERSIEMCHYSADAYLLLGKVYEAKGDLALDSRSQRTFYRQAILHCRNADTYNPRLFKESAIVRARIREKS